MKDADMNIRQTSCSCLPSGALDALKHVHFSKGQKRSRDKGQEKGVTSETTPIKLIHFLEKRVFPQKLDFDRNLRSNLCFTENQKWSVRSIGFFSTVRISKRVVKK